MAGIRDGTPGALLQGLRETGCGADIAIAGQLAEGSKGNGVELGYSLPDLGIGVRKLPRAEAWPDGGPFLSWNVGLDEVTPGPGARGDVYGQDLGHRHGGACRD